MLDSLKHLLIGSPLPTRQLAEQRLNKVRALAVFSPDAFSSIAYANQEIYLALVVAGSLGLARALPISLMITALLAIVALSYYQTIYGYPSGGGSYVVARENLGTLPGLAAGVGAHGGLCADRRRQPDGRGRSASPRPFRCCGSIASCCPSRLLVVLTLINLRGTRKPGTLMSGPVYLFLFAYLAMLAYGAYPGADRRHDAAGDHGAAGRPALDRVPAAARLRHRLHGDDRHRGDQQRRAGVQAARSEERRAHPAGHGRADGRAVRGQHRHDAGAWAWSAGRRRRSFPHWRGGSWVPARPICSSRCARC